MVDEQMTMTDDASHYEISLTAGQAFVAFVLLLFSLAASFAFGILIGKGQVDERLVVRHDPSVVQESRAVPARTHRIIELGVDKESAPAVAATATTLTEESPQPGAQTAASAAATAAALPGTVHPDGPIQPAPAMTSPAPAPLPVSSTPAVAHYAQLLSSSDAKSAETLAARLIDHGFPSAYVERGQSDHGPVFRVRVKFASESEARAALERLRPFASGEIWITRQ